ncbi:hypothetical protein C0Q70_21769 [Pomacea canaliculata]|uniref:Uncharacterized protein n=1 Tax=Pomacea canaliculata TaxID=400727 RepID=A0A2T7NAP2_POMCA|nr:uncharacterized protein LOC112556023 [Pomacea canaliculata]PVD18243.1 hypothetical protein C0Q70_21769 [Pomacea canaliculata]
MSDFQELKYGDRRQDWHQTSTEVGHHYRPGYYFPDTEFTTIIRDPLPPYLAKEDELTRGQHYQTTSGFYHDRKPHTLLYGERIHKKAPGHWKVNYIKDLAEKIGKGGWRQPLTMGNQLSEMKAEYNGQPGLREKYNFEEVFYPQNFTLQDHHKDGPSKYGEGSTQNPKLQGEPFYVRDKGILHNLDPYLSTTHKDHRSFKLSELKGYAKKDIPTFWDCEEYPKAWGHGQKHNSLPKHTVPREKLPMRDTMVFPTATKIPRPPKAMIPVPHQGLKSEYAGNYVPQDHVRQKENYYCAVDTPFVLPNPGTKSIFTAPKMYNTEYQHIGSNKPVTV